MLHKTENLNFLTEFIMKQNFKFLQRIHLDWFKKLLATELSLEDLTETDRNGDMCILLNPRQCSITCWIHGTVIPYDTMTQKLVPQVAYNYCCQLIVTCNTKAQILL